MVALVGVIALGIIGITVVGSGAGDDAAIPEAAAADAAPVATDTGTLDVVLAVDAALEDAGRPDARVRRRPRPVVSDSAPADAAPVDAAQVGKLRVSTSPWAEVWHAERGTLCRETPCTVELPAGKYRLRLSNPVAGVGMWIEITVREAQVTTVRESLTRSLP